MLESDNELGLIEIGNGLANVANVAHLPCPAACYLPDVPTLILYTCLLTYLVGTTLIPSCVCSTASRLSRL